MVARCRLRRVIRLELKLRRGVLRPPSFHATSHRRRCAEWSSNACHDENSAVAGARLHQNYTCDRTCGFCAAQLSDLLVAKGGIEPPTQGFSVLCSTN